MEDLINRFAQEEQLETVEQGDFVVGVGTLMRLLEKDRAEQLILHNASKRYAWLSPEGRSSNLWDEETHKNNITDEDIKEAESRGWKLLKFNVC